MRVFHLVSEFLFCSLPLLLNPSTAYPSPIDLSPPSTVTALPLTSYSSTFHRLAAPCSPSSCLLLPPTRLPPSPPTFHCLTFIVSEAVRFGFVWSLEIGGSNLDWSLPLLTDGLLAHLLLRFGTFYGFSVGGGFGSL